MASLRRTSSSRRGTAAASAAAGTGEGFAEVLMSVEDTEHREIQVKYTEREGEDGVFFSIHDFLFGDLRHWGHVGFVGVQRGGKEGGGWSGEL